MNKLLLAITLLLQGCMLRAPVSNRAPNPVPPPVKAVHHLTPKDFDEIDTNKDGSLDKAELKQATAPDTTTAPLKIFGALILGIAFICVLPMIPALTHKAVKLYKHRKSSDEPKK
tara:strand:- start:19198 stop:19542 length:345 start_codon:yes stop_codon:yes gene_type:complete